MQYMCPKCFADQYVRTMCSTCELCHATYTTTLGVKMAVLKRMAWGVASWIGFYWTVSLRFYIMFHLFGDHLDAFWKFTLSCYSLRWFKWLLVANLAFMVIVTVAEDFEENMDAIDTFEKNMNVKIHRIWYGGDPGEVDDLVYRLVGAWPVCLMLKLFLTTVRNIGLKIPLCVSTIGEWMGY